MEYLPKIYHIIKEAINNLASEVILTEEYSSQEICATVRNVMRNNPQYFWYAHRYDFAPGTRTIAFYYTFSKEKVDFFTAQIKTVIEKDFQLEYVRTLSPLKQICYIYKWLIQYTNYNTESAFNQTIVSIFVKRNSVCTGYAKAAQYLCQLLGIESKLVFGRLHNDKGDGRHCWNIVKLNGNWYHIDVCLGDPSVAKNILPTSSIASAQDTHILYDNFCVSTEKILETRSIEDVDTLPDCSNCIDSIPGVKLQSTSRPSNLGCQVTTVGMTSKVYLAIDDKHKVIKTVEGKDWKKLVENERKCFTAFSECPNILRYYGGTDNQLFLEQATPLTDLMQSHYYKPTINSVLKLMIDIATAVKYCFDKGFAYRDVHIGNIYLRCDRTWALGDFGHCVPITADNTYSDVVGHPRFIPQTTITSGLFDRSSATYSLIKILEFIMDEYKLSLSNISERIACGLKEHKSEDPLETLISILANDCEKVSSEFCDEPDVRRSQTDITFVDDIESLAIPSADVDGAADEHLDNLNESDNLNDAFISDDIVDSATTYGIYVNSISSPTVTIDESLIEQCNDNTDIESFATSAAISISESRGHSSSQIEDDSEFKKKRVELKKRLLDSGKITISLRDNENRSTRSIPDGKLASPDRPSSFIPQNGSDRKSSDGIDNCTDQYPMSTPAPHSPYSDTPGYTSRNSIIKYILSHLNFTRKLREKKDNFWNNTSIRTQYVSTQTINSCVYAPAEVSRDDYMLVQVYLYRDEESDQVRAKATTVDKSAEIRQYKPLELPIKKGDKISIHLKMKGIDIDVDTKSFHWSGSFKSCEFSVYVPKDYSRSTILGTVDVFINNMPAGEMIFKTAIVNTIQSKLLANIDARAFERIFVSYSHKDTPIVRPLVEGLRIAKKDYFFDRHTLKGGEKYREEIRKWIDTSDVFVLCWSKNAAESIEVASEKDYALEVISRDGSRLRLYPISISPEAPLPSDMNDTYNFAQLNP